MERAIKFAKDILEKEKNIKGSQSAKLKRDLQKSVYSDYQELSYYCKIKNINMQSVISKAKEMEGSGIQH